MNYRWAIYIDVEGFTSNYEHSEVRKNFALDALNELMSSIYKIGTQCYQGNSDRLLAHQFGDGFIICSDFPEQDASRAISIAVAIMRHMIIEGYATKAAISVGDMTGIKGWYPDFARNTENDSFALGAGVMTIIPVMGTALTKAHKLIGKQKGAVLILDTELAKLGLPEGIVFSNDSWFCINWISSNLTLSDQIAEISGLKRESTENLNNFLESYFQKGPCPPPTDWIQSTRKNVRYEQKKSSVM